MAQLENYVREFYTSEKPDMSGEPGNWDHQLVAIKELFGMANLPILVSLHPLHDSPGSFVVVVKDCQAEWSTALAHDEVDGETIYDRVNEALKETGYLWRFRIPHEDDWDPYRILLRSYPPTHPGLLNSNLDAA